MLRKDTDFMIILKVTKKQGFTLSLENTLLGKQQEGGGGQIDPSQLFKGKPLPLTDNEFLTPIQWPFLFYLTLASVVVATCEC